MKLSIKVAFIALILMSFTYKVTKQLWFTKTAKITFFSTTPVEDIKAINKAVIFVFDQDAGDISAKVTIKSFMFKKKLMQEHFNENYMESDKFPYASYKGKILDIKKIDFTKDSTHRVKTKGKLTIHGVTKEVTASGTLKVVGNQATIKTNFDVLLKDYGIKKPSVVALKIADKINVTIESTCKKKQ